MTGKVYRHRGAVLPTGLPSIIAIGRSNPKDQVWFLTDTQIGHADYPSITRDILSVKAFNDRFVESPDDSLEAIARILNDYARAYGITSIARTELNRFLPKHLNEEPISMPTPMVNGGAPAAAVKKTAAVKSAKKLDEALDAKPAKAPAAPKAAKAPAAPAAPKAEKPPKAAAAPKEPKTPAAPKEPKEKRPSVSGFISDLIMAGKLTDDQIFAEAKKAFPALDDGKRSYVTWNRNNLTKKGMNPPQPVIDKALAPTTSMKDTAAAAIKKTVTPEAPKKPKK